MELRDCVVFVTGASSGLGRALAQAFAPAGAHVAVGYRVGAEAAAQTCAGIRAQGVRAQAVRLDQTDPASIEAAVAEVVKVFGRIDVLVNCAAWSTDVPFANLEAMTPELWDRIQQTNLRGPFLVCKAVAPVLRAQRSGSVVLIGSIWGHEGFGLFASYCASKGGLKLLMQAFAKEMIPHGVRVNAVAPGMVNTGIHQNALRHEAEARGVSYETVRDQEWSKIPIGHAGEPVDIADAVLWLTSDAASYVVGSTIDVNGGVLFH